MAPDAVDPTAPIASNREFTLTVDFRPLEGRPDRVFASMAQLVLASQRLDSALASTLPVRVTPSVRLERIEAGSLRAVLQTILEPLKETSLGDAIPLSLIDEYLLGAKKVVARFIGSPAKPSKESVRELQREIAEAAPPALREAVFFSSPSASSLAPVLQDFSEGLTMLDPDDAVTFGTQDETVPMNTGFRLSKVEAEALVVQQEIVNTSEVILKVKRPDYLGTSMWEFARAGKSLHAKVADQEWLAEFRHRRVQLAPQDSLRVRMLTTTKYDQRSEVTSEHHEVVEVLEVIPPDSAEQEAF